VQAPQHHAKGGGVATSTSVAPIQTGTAGRVPAMPANGYGPENITRLRRFAIGLPKGKKSAETIPEKMKKLLLNTRAVFDILKMIRNAMPRGGNSALA
jgi:hypothetical protein